MPDSGRKQPHLVLDDNLAKMAIKSVQKAINTLFGATVTAGAPQLLETSESRGDVSGIVGMVQEAVEATMVLSFQKETLYTLMSVLYGKTFEQVDNSIKQGVGELTNIIYALLKKELNDRGFGFKMSVPSIVIGAGHSIYNIHQGKSMIIPFTVEAGGLFYLEITLQQTL